MGESATALDIQEPSRFNWSLNNKVIIKSPQSQLGTNEILTPYAAAGITKRKNEQSMQPPVLLVHLSINQNVVLLHATLHRNYEIHVDIGTLCTVPNHASHAPFNRMWTYSYATQGSLLFLRHFREYTCRKRDCPIEKKCGRQCSAGRYTTWCSDPTCATPHYLCLARISVVEIRELVHRIR